MADAKIRQLSSDRRLAAIMFTDIVGYTTMMSEDEQKTLSLLRINRETHKKLIFQFGGKFLKEMGDGILASFENSSDAVICAAAIQKASIESNIELRIGIHMGEVTFENNDVFGDGVNIASRIQPLAEPGQILISETVQNNVQNKPGITTHLIGEKDLKNVAKAKVIYVVDVHEDFLTPGIRTTSNRTLSLGLAAVVVLVVIVTGLGGYWFGLRSQNPPPANPVIRYDIELASPLGRLGRRAMAFSQDGKYLCYVSEQKLFLKALDDEGSGTPVAGAFDPRAPTFSPDGKWIAYDEPTTNKLVKIAVTGGTPKEICSLAGGAYSLRWSGTNVYFGMNNDYWQVSANGGQPQKVHSGDSTGVMVNPQILPDGKTILFSTVGHDSQPIGVQFAALGENSQPQMLIMGAKDARVLSSGHIAYLKDESLQIIEFDQASKKLGKSQVLLSGQIWSNAYLGQFAFSEQGAFVYWNANVVSETERKLVWVDLSGNVEQISREPNKLLSPSISSDGQSIAVDVDKGDDIYDIHLYNPTLGTASHFQTQNSTINPVWSPDNTSISYFQFEEPRGVYMKPVDQSYAPKLLFESREIVNLGNWSKDGRYLLFRTPDGIGYYDRHEEKTFMLDFISTENLQEVFYPRLSPDGKWLSYTSDDEYNQDHVYVVPFPGPGRAHRISVDEGHASVWAPDMSAIYFIGQEVGGRNVSKAMIQTEPTFSSSEPEVLFRGNYSVQYQFSGAGSYQFGNSGVFDIHPDGDRFLMLQGLGDKEDEASDLFKLHVVANWPGLLLLGE